MRPSWLSDRAHQAAVGRGLLVSVGVAIAAYYALWLNTELWNVVLPPEGPRWRLPPRSLQLASLYGIYVVLGVIGRLLSPRALWVLVAGFLGFTYGLPSDGGRWEWSDVNCCYTVWLQIQFLWRMFREMEWAALGALHGAITVFLAIGWLVANAAFAWLKAAAATTKGGESRTTTG